MTDYRFITYEQLDDGRIARITMNRPRYRNAQNRTLLVELNDAFLAAERDDDVRVVILAGAWHCLLLRARHGYTRPRRRTRSRAGHPPVLHRGRKLP